MRLRNILASTVFAAATVLAAGSASAAPINFTWSPSNVGLTGGTITGVNNFNVADFATISILDASGNFSETGALNVTGFLNGGSSVVTTGLGTTYSLYYTFNATGNQGGPIPVVNGTSVTGTFSSLSYTLWASPTSNPTFTVGAGGVTITGNAGAFALATGSMVGGGAANTVTLTKLSSGLSPSANIEVSLDPCFGAGGVCTVDASSFFVDPDATSTVLQFGNFGATTTVTSLHGNQVWINGGGGNITQDVIVPEPVTLSVFGAGIAGIAALRRRKAKKA